jgi:hypothetical protein
MSNSQPTPITAKIKTVQTPVTPQMAMAWLEKNTHNRPVSQGQVDRYARDMAMGRWRITHQGIAISDVGTVIDGQHRLWAVIESQRTVIMQVTTGLPLDTQEAIDGGLGRSARDVIALRDGEKLETIHMGVARLLARQITGIDSPTRQEIIDCFGVHRARIAQAVEMFPARVRYIRTATIATVITRALYTEDATDVARFVQILCDGVRADSDEPQRRDDNALLLRKFVIGEHAHFSGRGLRPTAADIYYKTERALRAYLDRDRLKSLYAASEEMFRVPGEAPKKPKKSKERERLRLKAVAKRKEQVPA